MTKSHPVCVRYHQAVELIGARWSGAIVRAVQTDQRHFAEIRAAIPGISDTMLAARLRELETAGVLRREADAAGRITYDLTPKGRDLEPVIDALRVWAHRWIPLPADPGSDADAGTATGSDADLGTAPRSDARTAPEKRIAR